MFLQILFAKEMIRCCKEIDFLINQQILMIFSFLCFTKDNLSFANRRQPFFSPQSGQIPFST